MSAQQIQNPKSKTQNRQGFFEITTEPLNIGEIARRIVPVECGATVTLDGYVRQFTKGRETLYLVYEAYEAMALAKMQEIAAHLHSNFAIHRVAIVHRLGRLEIGETSVFIAVSSAHRAAAFDACRYAIDTLKKTVPIWKKEFFADGAVWADGELPPAPNAPAETLSDAKTPAAKPASN